MMKQRQWQDAGGGGDRCEQKQQSQWESSMSAVVVRTTFVDEHERARPENATPGATAEPALLQDYRLAYLSRQVSIVGRREVMRGRANFGIFGDGKELAQLALAKVFAPGDWRSGYYRDQTWMLALGITTPAQIFAQLYGHTDVTAEPASAGRSMVSHYATRWLDEEGQWRPQSNAYNSPMDLSATAGQMPRLVGLAYASRLYREVAALHPFPQFSQQGNEVAFGTIGNGSCAQGLFWETLNAIGVLQVPAVISIWDDEYGISVPNQQQLMGGDLTRLLAGFQRTARHAHGFDLYQARGWDYKELVKVYRQAAQTARRHHSPAVVHVTEMTQPLGHSSSGSHERYKAPERLAWEAEFDPLRQMRHWLINEELVRESELAEVEQQVRQAVETTCEQAWQALVLPLQSDAHELASLLTQAAQTSPQGESLHRLSEALRTAERPTRKQMLQTAGLALRQLRQEENPVRAQLVAWQTTTRMAGQQQYGAHLYNQSVCSALRVPVVAPVYGPNAPEVAGFALLQANFAALLARDPRIFLFGEDVGRLGDVNQGLAGLQARFGELRIADTGVREATIIGQAIGMALRGLRPIPEIQYLDYIWYAAATLTDDLACLHWRTAGGQAAPVIIRTRGHRLEGIWHSGSPMGALLHLLRGLYIVVPRNMTQAAGFYNTLLRSDDPALVVEVLNGYRLKEKLPENLAEFTVPLGVPEVLRPGADVTLVTYGACCRIALEAAERLYEVGIEMAVIDVQTLLPFDLPRTILASLQKTNRIVFLDEDVPGGATAYMLQQVLEQQGGYQWLDSPPRTVTAQPHRPAYGADGDYFSKPNVEDLFDTVYDLLHEAAPARYPRFDQ